MKEYKLTIHDLEWRVKFVKENDSKLDKACGITYKDDCDIYVSINLPDNLLGRTIRHEITHAYLWTYGFENAISKKFDEEDVCNFVETYAPLICKDTKNVYDWYKGGNNNE